MRHFNKPAFATVIGLAAALLLFAIVPGAVSGAAAQSGDGDDDIIHFALTTHDGRRVSEQDFHGRYMLVQFGYTWCPDVCPMELSLLSEVIDALGAEAEKVQPLFITFDPMRDSAAVLADYVANFHPAIIGLTGSQAEIARTVNNFGVVLLREEEAAEGGGYAFAHSAHTYLLGPRGEYRGSIESLASPDEVASGLVEFLRGEAAAAAAAAE
ncbi:MAG: SCO family protein [Alphaproteobacteria bacterium]|jgi:protein SCO1/2|nr:SCO family protein [Alphaproteobacteria bacterium]MDP6589007.1 SCO family protein [Alphaproteobacteria bacterium]MDP6819451.1 SCO family protein [Alphaproteobacteria bacterium]|tara:strand:+ start:51 stop:686 length:636 start_codon:yes stop_codon:yes gene_type:complete